jgi:hypothetical protein
MGQACRVCENTLALSGNTLDYSTVIADVKALENDCAVVEVDLRDSFNAFCFKCRRITMSVPKSVTTSEQVAYLRYQVNCFQQMCAYGLVVNDNPFKK